MVTPFGISPLWLAEYFRRRNCGTNDCEARLRADIAANVTGKGFARSVIRGANKDIYASLPVITLTIPVAGGSSVLKRRNADPLLSEHGKWRREHLGALSASYGRTPFYDHLMPEIEAVYVRSEGMTLEEFNSRMLNVALGWLEITAVMRDRERLSSVISCISARVERDISIFDSIFRLGRETSFAVAAEIARG